MASEVEVEGLRLLMTDAEAKALCDQHGWEHDIGIGDDAASVAPGEPVDTIRCRFEGGKLVTIDVAYDSPQLDRARSFGHSLPIQKQATIMGRPAWSAFTLDRAIAVTGDGAGKTVTGVHLGVLKSQREVDAIMATFGGGLEPPVRT